MLRLGAEKHETWYHVLLRVPHFTNGVVRHCIVASSFRLSYKLLLHANAFAVGGGVVVEDQPDVSAVLSAYNQQGDPTLYEEYYSGLKHFIECSLDCHRAELSQLFYPLFVHMYLELVYNQHESEAKSFFER